MVNITVLVSVLALAFLAYYKGSRILLTAIISFYPSSMIYQAIPSKEKALFLGTEGTGLFYSHALIFGLVFTIVFLAVYRITQNEGLGHGNKRLINAFLIGSSFTVVVIALCFHVLPSYNIFQLTNSSVTGFWNSNYGYLTAICLPLLAIWRLSRGGLDLG
jgi:phosphoglycerol transferase MdoB-like AlkP superfamily enzyme